MTPPVLYINEDNLIRWDEAALSSDDSYINAGTGTWALKTAAGTSVGSGSLTYVTSSNGRWHATIDKLTVDDLTEEGTYYLELTLSNGSGADGFRRFEVVAKYHGLEP